MRFLDQQQIRKEEFFFFVVSSLSVRIETYEFVEVILIKVGVRGHLLS